jgi:acyl-CoA reductase-like NAD-dependent aldehyde dehydrogenase
MSGDAQLLIDGRAVPGEGQSFAVLNPATGAAFAEVAGASAAQVNAAIAAARRAFDSGVWSGLPAKERAAVLRRLMEYLASQRDRLIDMVVR